MSQAAVSFQQQKHTSAVQFQPWRLITTCKHINDCLFFDCYFVLLIIFILLLEMVEVAWGVAYPESIYSTFLLVLSWFSIGRQETSSAGTNVHSVDLTEHATCFMIVKEKNQGLLTNIQWLESQTTHLRIKV